MMNRNLPWLTGGLAIAVCTLLSVSLVGCSPQVEEDEVVRDTAPPPPPPPPERTATPIDELKDRLRIDERVYLPEDQAPETDEERTALLEFFDAFVRGDHRTVSSMLSDIDRNELERMVQSGQWEAVTSRISRIDIQTGSPANVSYDFDLDSMAGMGLGMEHMAEIFSDAGIEALEESIRSGEFREMVGSVLSEAHIQEIEAMVESGEFRRQLEQAAGAMEEMMHAIQIGDQCALALFDVDGEYQAQLWYFTLDGNGVRFDAAPTPHDIVNRLSGTDWIASWHEIVLQELVMAELPDDLAESRPQIVLDDGEDDEPDRRSPRDGPPAPTPPLPPSPPTLQ